MKDNGRSMGRTVGIIHLERTDAEATRRRQSRTALGIPSGLTPAGALHRGEATGAPGRPARRRVTGTCAVHGAVAWRESLALIDWKIELGCFHECLDTIVGDQNTLGMRFSNIRIHILLPSPSPPPTRPRAATAITRSRTRSSQRHSAAPAPANAYPPHPAPPCPYEGPHPPG